MRVIYEAKDGERFLSSEECLTYENSMEMEPIVRILIHNLCEKHAIQPAFFVIKDVQGEFFQGDIDEIVEIIIEDLETLSKNNCNTPMGILRYIMEESANTNSCFGSVCTLWASPDYEKSNLILLG